MKPYVLLQKVLDAVEERIGGEQLCCFHICLPEQIMEEYVCPK